MKIVDNRSRCKELVNSASVSGNYQIGNEILKDVLAHIQTLYSKFLCQ